MKKFTWMIIALVWGIGVVYAQDNADEITDGQYFMSKKVNGDIQTVEENLKGILKDQGFSVVTEISMDKTLAEKLDVRIMPYRILGVCNAGYAYQTLQVEENIGVFLPCKIILKQVEPETTEVVAVNPSSLMEMLGNDELVKIAGEVTKKFRMVMEEL